MLRLAIWAIVPILSLVLPDTARALDVVVSIAPLHSLVAGVMGPSTNPVLLIPGGQSPHTFSLRPSTARDIAGADIVFRIGPTYEFALNQALAEARHARVIDMISVPGMTLYPARDLDEGAASAPAGEAMRSVEPDPHIWLDPHNARIMTAVIARTLGEADAAHADEYRANAAKLDQELAALDERIAQDLTPVHERPYLVFHDGYQYFERRYGLSFAGAVTEMPGRSPGARHIQMLRREIAAAHVTCVFAEPQFEPRLVHTVTEGLPIRSGVLDPLGAAMAPGASLYFDVLQGLSQSLRSCLDGE